MTAIAKRTRKKGVVTNSVGAPTKLNDEVLSKLIEALDSSSGNITYACKAAGISRNSYYLWLKNNPQFKEKVDDINEGAVDFAESKLKEHIANGDTTCLIFFLKTKGRARGYVERVENINTNMQVVWNEEKTYIDERSRPIDQNGS
jgi:hypothetical protein